MKFLIASAIVATCLMPSGAAVAQQCPPTQCDLTQLQPPDPAAQLATLLVGCLRKLSDGSFSEDAFCVAMGRAFNPPGSAPVPD